MNWILGQYEARRGERVESLGWRLQKRLRCERSAKRGGLTSYTTGESARKATCAGMLIPFLGSSGTVNIPSSGSSLKRCLRCCQYRGRTCWKMWQSIWEGCHMARRSCLWTCFAITFTLYRLKEIVIPQISCHKHCRVRHASTKSAVYQWKWI